VRFTRIDTSSRRAAAQASGAIINPPNVGLSDKGSAMGTARSGDEWAPLVGSGFDVAAVQAAAQRRSHEDAAVRRANEAAGE
jgi:hypothetical protein